MNLIEVSRHKDELKINYPVYFSSDLLSFIKEKDSEVEDPIFSILVSIPLGIWAQKIDGWAASIVVFFKKKMIIRTDEILVFSAIYEGDICLVCIKEEELNNFPKEVEINNGDKIYFFGDILSYKPLLKKNKTRLKAFFDEEQALNILAEFERNFKSMLN